MTGMGRLSQAPRTSGQLVEPSTNNIDVGTYVRDITYAETLQKEFDDLKVKFYEGLVTLASGSMVNGMKLTMEMSHGQVDLMVLQQMAKRDEITFFLERS